MDAVDASHGPTFEELQRIVGPIAKEHGMARVYLFGSRARGDHSRGSDFDFCVVAQEGRSLFDLGGFLYDLRDALGTDVDVVCESGLHNRPHFMEEMLRDRKVVFEE
ncbi:MAG: nucleotidyltransferase domain-containing protein [Methanomassiliicoccaceae archaeon]|nr:nucleotidyltransferase domain-containing protein [Methanomassiliicoccaceae archaeon]